MKPHHKRKIRSISWVLFCGYLIIMAYFLFFSEYLNRDGARVYRYNLVLLQEVKRSFWCLRAGMTSYFLLNFVMNILAFVPFGFFLPLLSKKKHAKNIMYVMLTVLEFTLVIEITQLILKVGIFDVDDILLNVTGGLVGYLIFSIVYLGYRIYYRIHSR